MIKADETHAEPGRYRIAVRELCAFAAREGDLDLRFTPSPTAQQGIRGHQRIVRRRGKDYESEISLSGDIGNLTIRGRADGYDPKRNCLEEIKTHRGDLSRQPAHHRALHWAQARVYGALMCRSRDLEGITLALVYLDIAADAPRDAKGSQDEQNEQDAGTLDDRDEQTDQADPKSRKAQHDEQRLEAWWSREALEAELARLAARFSEFAANELAHRSARDSALSRLAFPWPSWRPGQRQLAEHAYKAVMTGRELLAEAPTGTGKTLATLYPALRAMPASGTDRLFYLTARTPGRALALDALATLAPAADDSEGQKKTPATPLRILELGARSKTCEHPTLACHGESCPLARGFYDRLPAARDAALADRRPLNLATTRRHAMAHDICPYFLAQELSRWADVIIGDHNHYFDSHALLFALAQANDWRTVVLVDESHNLIERARGMYSTELDARQFHFLLKQLSRTGHPAPLRSASRALARQWRALEQNEQGTDDETQASKVDSNDAGHKAQRLALEALPGDFLKALSQWTGAMGDWLAEPDKAASPAATRQQPARATATQAPEQLGLIACDASSAAPSATDTGSATTVSGSASSTARRRVEPDVEMMEAYFAALTLARLAEGFGDHSLFEVELAATPPARQASLASDSSSSSGAASAVGAEAEAVGSEAEAGAAARPRKARGRSVRQIQPRLRCVSPAPWLAPRLRASHATLLFSATLNPPAYHHRLLGLADDAVWLSVDSPFSAAQVQVSRHRLSTRLRDRDASCRPIAELTARQYRQRPGNYLAFFSSFAYLEQVASTLQQLAPEIPQWRQTRAMTEAERTRFIQRFTPEGQGIGFAVLGGAFGEGIDLPGSRLIGAFIATLGLAGFSPENEALKQRLATWLDNDAQRRSQPQQAEGDPHDDTRASRPVIQPLNADDCTYLYPGLTRVVQAAGRVIRSEQDQGVIHLIDDRFMRPEVARLLPRWWTPTN
ncbi:helicase C-terminal domain-containing protein [Cobetia amphilecti]|uniref:Helicase C-terminal domain-containing protein n=1 Tax=Cobetia amphilecti TaxID=1055104 RepID=A0AAP4X009_9GAMM|nr:helicase C-terminal domain-containing protein [Cobetia amphilecti]MDO6671541.1 helicase C-terminal domain-containing protein [Cobetia amphilecti]